MRAILEGDFNLSDAATQSEVYKVVTLLNLA